MTKTKKSTLFKKRIRELAKSRDNWKELHKQGQTERKRLRAKVQDEIVRRDHWKECYQKKTQVEKKLSKKIVSIKQELHKKEHENEELERQLEEAKKKLKV